MKKRIVYLVVVRDPLKIFYQRTYEFTSKREMKAFIRDLRAAGMDYVTTEFEV